METLLLEKAVSKVVDELDRLGDFIIPTTRKGLQVLLLYKCSRKLFTQGKIIFFEYLDFYNEILKKKNVNIALFDESVNHGHHLNNLKSKLLRYSIKNKLNIKKENIHTIALVVNKEAKLKLTYHPPGFRVNSNRYVQLSKLINNEILSSGRPMDIDHLILTLAFNIEKNNTIISILKKQLSAEELNHSGIFNNVRMFTIDLQEKSAKFIYKFDIRNIKGCPKLFKDGPEKIRLFLKGNILYIVPIIYPSMVINDDVQSDYVNCPLKNLPASISLCNYNVRNFNGNNNIKNILCYNCIINIFNIEIISKFLIELDKYFKDFTIEDLEVGYINMFSHDEIQNINNQLMQKIKKNRDNELIITIGEGIADMCEYEVDFSSNNLKKGAFNNLELNENGNIRKIKPSPELEIAIIINLLKEKSIPLFQYDEYQIEINPIPKSLTYKQIFEVVKMYNGLKENEISKGIDTGLDIGLFKPITIFEGIQGFFLDTPYRIISRMYTIPSEDLDKSLRCFHNLIK